MEKIFDGIQKKKMPIIMFALMAINISIPLPGETPEIDENEPKKEYIVVSKHFAPITAYSSTPDQTDSTPCITANGFNLCTHNTENIIATNDLAFNTMVRIPELFGERIFYVKDRMNKRYTKTKTIDVWMKDRKSAIHFGYKKAKIEIVRELTEATVVTADQP